LWNFLGIKTKINQVKNKRMISKEVLINLFFPKFCFGCFKEGEYLCSDCLKKISKEELSCPICRRVNFKGIFCPSHQRYSKLEGLLFYSNFSELPQKLVYGLKYEGLKDIGKLMANLMSERLKEHFLFQDKDRIILCPLPLYWLKKLKRGFNQAEVLTRNIGQNLNLEILNLLLRIKNTQSQTQLEKIERQKNVANAFFLSQKINPDQIRDKIIILIDDVYTTGYTLNAAAKELKKLKPKSIWGLVFAKD